jgi:hypothetical protein
MLKQQKASQFSQATHSDRLYEDPASKEHRMWQLQEKIYKENGYSFAPEIKSTNEYYEVTKLHKKRNDALSSFTTDEEDTAREGAVSQNEADTTSKAKRAGPQEANFTKMTFEERNREFQLRK